MFSCYTLDLIKDGALVQGLPKHERDAIAHSLRKLTNRIVHPKTGLWRGDAVKIETLNARREELLHQVLLLERIYWLLEDANYGTLPFAGLLALDLWLSRC